MKKLPLLTSALLIPLLASCGLQQQNGDPRATPPYALREQPWKISRKAVAPNDDRICTVSAGDLDVTLRGTGEHASQQVATSLDLQPGYRYTILIGPKVYRSTEGRFDGKEAHSIIEHMMSAKVVYTQVREATVERPRAPMDNLNNKIGLNGFADAYETCEAFIKKTAYY